MAGLFNGLSGRVLPRLGQDPSREDGFRSWLIRGTYQAEPESIADNIILSNIDNAEILSFMNYDYERFAFSSRESVCLASLESRSSQLVSWPLLKLYYSAFFAAHATMRSIGEGVVKLERDQASKINEIVGIFTGGNPGIKPGMFV